MIARDFILEASLELQEKSKDIKFWKDEELFIKLARAYRKIQKDLPCFVSNEKLDLKEGIDLYNLKNKSIKAISLYINGIKYTEQIKEYIYTNTNDEKIFNISDKELLISPTPLVSNFKIKATYYYQKDLENENDYITTPIEYEEALRLLFLSYVFEKPPRDMRERDLSIHYLKRYELEKAELKKYKRNTKSVNITYQRI